MTITRPFKDGQPFASQDTDIRFLFTRHLPDSPGSGVWMSSLDSDTSSGRPSPQAGARDAINGVHGKGAHGTRDTVGGLSTGVPALSKQWDKSETCPTRGSGSPTRDLETGMQRQIKRWDSETYPSLGSGAPARTGSWNTTDTIHSRLTGAPGTWMWKSAGTESRCDASSKSKTLGFGIDRILSIDSKRKETSVPPPVVLKPQPHPSQIPCLACHISVTSQFPSPSRPFQPKIRLPSKFMCRHSSFQTGFPPPLPSVDLHLSSRRKRSWSRTVFSSLQRKGLEKRFKIQKYVSKPDRRQLAAILGLTDAQVKVWFQNRRMKWRHSQEYKKDLESEPKD